MKHLSLLIILLYIPLQADTCRPISNDDISNLEKDYEYTVSVKSGVVCDYLIYWKGYTSDFLKQEVCEYIDFNSNTKKIIIGNTYRYYHFDEFNVIDDQSIKENSNMNCIDLYKSFKKKIK